MANARAWIALALCLSAPLAGGCSTELETGYQPRSLTASEADRRSYYAPAFSPAAQADKSGTGFSLQP